PCSRIYPSVDKPQVVPSSCFFRLLETLFVDSFVRAFRRGPALSTPQAFSLSEALPASFAKLIAAFRSRSMTSPQSGRNGLRQRNTRSFSSKVSSTHPQQEHVLLEAIHRSARLMRHPYQAALYVNCRRNSYQPTSPIACAR